MSLFDYLVDFRFSDEDVSPDLRYGDVEFLSVLAKGVLGYSEDGACILHGDELVFVSWAEQVFEPVECCDNALPLLQR